MVFKLDIAGGAEVLKELVADEIAALAQQVANAAGDGAVMELRTTDRAEAFVRVPPAAQAKDGVLSKAAAAVGLEVRPAKYPPAKKKTSTDKPARRTRKRKSK